MPGPVCRSSEAKKREEWQADFYASCLLMPKSLVIAAWQERFGDTKARVLKRKNRIVLDNNVSEERANELRSFNQQQDDEVSNRLAGPFARKFLVSPVAMRIRLERLHLLLRDVPRQRSLILGA